MFSSQTGLPNQVWLFRGNVVSHMARIWSASHRFVIIVASKKVALSPPRKKMVKTQIRCVDNNKGTYFDISIN